MVKKQKSLWVSFSAVFHEQLFFHSNLFFTINVTSSPWGLKITFALASEASICNCLEQDLSCFSDPGWLWSKAL